MPAGYREGSATETVVNISDDDVAQVAVSFGSAAYSVPEGASRSITVNLSADPQRTVTVPLSRTNQGGAAGSDYSLPSSVTFNSGQTTRTVSFSATSDAIDDDGESVKLGFSNLPAGVTTGTTDETTVSIVDDDDPAVTVGFEQTAYTIPEGDGESIAVVRTAIRSGGSRSCSRSHPWTQSRPTSKSSGLTPATRGCSVFDAGVTERTFTFIRSPTTRRTTAKRSRSASTRHRRTG